MRDKKENKMKGKEILIDRDSLKGIICEILDGDLASHNPVLVWDKFNGVFSIQSKLNFMCKDEYIINTSENGMLREFLGNLEIKEVDNFVDNMTDEYIVEHIIGDFEDSEPWL